MAAIKGRHAAERSPGAGACVISAKKRSTRFNQETPVGVKMEMKPQMLPESRFHRGMLK
jgi:hypothetical protein